LSKRILRNILVRAEEEKKGATRTVLLHPESEKCKLLEAAEMAINTAIWSAIILSEDPLSSSADRRSGIKEGKAMLTRGA